MDVFLSVLSKRLKKDSISVWTVGNRQVATKEIYMHKIMIELARKIWIIAFDEFHTKNNNEKGCQKRMLIVVIIRITGDND